MTNAVSMNAALTIGSAPTTVSGPVTKTVSGTIQLPQGSGVSYSAVYGDSASGNILTNDSTLTLTGNVTG